ncbi:MAG: DUF4062 domain-containing protein [Desulfobaccales bacterium]
MPRDENVITVFVASPADVAEERAALEDVIRELNITWSKTLGLRLELVRWETNAYPDFGEDAQNVVNRQIGDDYDIIVGIMWARYGTPTKRSGSGTEEEFHRAFDRYKEGSNIKIMFYFKDTPISPSKLDHDQLRLVSEFKAQLGNKGGLYWEFSTLEEFQSLIRVHLSRVVQEWKKCKQKKFKNQPNELIVNEGLQISNEEGEELGYLDYIEMANDSLLKVHELLMRITQYQLELNNKINQRTEELNKIDKAPKEVMMKMFKHILQNSAENMEEFVVRIEVEIPIYSKAFQDAIMAIGNIITLSTEFGMDNKNELNELLNAVSIFISSTPSTIESIKGFRSSIQNLPGMVTRQNLAKKKTINSLDKLVGVFETNLNLVFEVEKALRIKISNPECK